MKRLFKNLSWERFGMIFAIISWTIFFYACEQDRATDEIEDELLEYRALPNWANGYLTNSNANWDSSSGTLTITQNVNWTSRGKEGFYFNVPNAVKKIVIAKDKTVTGGFRVYEHSNNLLIKGATNNNTKTKRTATIFGTSSTGWSNSNNVGDNDKWKYGAIAVRTSGVVTIKNLKVLNSRSYGITSFNTKLVARYIDIVDNRGGSNNNSDGFGGGPGSVIKNSFINVLDDGIKLYYDNSTVQNVTIRHNRNGAPIQLGWYNEPGSSNINITNLKIKGNDSQGYNMGVFTWARRGPSAPFKKTLNISNFNLETLSGKVTPHLIQLGNNDNNDAEWNGEIEFTGNWTPACGYKNNYKNFTGSGYQTKSTVGNNKTLRKNNGNKAKVLVSGC